jgi:hypothetical protein
VPQTSITLLTMATLSTREALLTDMLNQLYFALFTVL